MSYVLNFPKKIAASATGKFHDQSGRIPEDWWYNDRPSILGLDLDDTMKKTDKELQDDMWNLMSWTSMGDLETIARRAFNQFVGRHGGTFIDASLTRIVKNDSNTFHWVNKFISNFEENLKNVNGNIDAVVSTPLGRPTFDNSWSRVGGLGILIHQVWAYEMWLNSFVIDPRTGNYTGNLEVKMYDHFGLDSEDVKKGNKRWFQPYGSEDGFNAWWVLQHYRGCAPLLLEIVFNKKLSGKIALNSYTRW